MALDFNNAEAQSGGGSLIPDNTIAPVILNMRGLKKTNAGDAEMLDCEFVITDGPFVKRRFWGNMMITSNGSDGHNKAVDITKSRVRGILESVYGIDPADDSAAAMSARTIEDWTDLDGLEFIAKIGIEKSKDPQYSDKNALRAAITPDQKEYEGFKPAKPKASGMVASQTKPDATANGDASKRPAWA